MHFQFEVNWTSMRLCNRNDVLKTNLWFHPEILIIMTIYCIIINMGQLEYIGLSGRSKVILQVKLIGLGDMVQY